MPSLQQDPLPASRAPRLTRVQNLRRGLHGLFTGSSDVGWPTSADGPKTPRLKLAPRNSHAIMLGLPRILRAYASPPAGLSPRPTQASPNLTPLSRPIAPNSLRGTMNLPQPLTPSSDRLFVGVALEEHVAEPSRRTRQHRTTRSKKKRSCALKLTDRRIRSKLIVCSISAILLTIVLTTCKVSQGSVCNFLTISFRFGSCTVKSR